MKIPKIYSIDPISWGLAISKLSSSPDFANYDKETVPEKNYIWLKTSENYGVACCSPNEAQPTWTKVKLIEIATISFAITPKVMIKACIIEIILFVNSMKDFYISVENVNGLLTTISTIDHANRHLKKLLL